MTTFASIVFYLMCVLFFGSFCSMFEKSDKVKDRITSFVFSIAFFIIAAGLQVFG